MSASAAKSNESSSLYSHELPGGAAWSAPVQAGRTITFTAMAADANLTVLLIGANRLDRMNIPDTLKAQMSACIKVPMVLMSDRGLALATVVSSSLPWHDALGGIGHPRHLDRFGATSYAVDRNEWRRSARTGLISELTKHGLGEADLHGCVNFFSKLGIADDAQASLAYVAGHCTTGDQVTLRTEQDVLLVCASTPHPMNPNAEYRPAGVLVDVGKAEPVLADDAAMTFRDESARALLETQKAFA
ncbi:DUF1989 domain-containing protein [Jatrophihabitans sp. DSM 45814]